MGDIATTLKKDTAQIKKLDENRKFLLLILFVVLFVISVLAGGFFSRSGKQPTSTETVVTAEVSPKPATTLSLSPASKSLTVGQAETITVAISKKPVSAIDVVVIFDPTVLTVSKLQKGTVFDRAIQQKVAGNKIIFSAAINADQKNALKEGTVFTFVVTPKKTAKSTALQFDPTATITALDGENTLGSALGATFTVQ